MIKVTPDTYTDMNKEFIEEDIPFRLTIPTQQEIDECITKSKGYYPQVVHQPQYTDSEIELHFGSEYESGIDYE